MMKGRRLTLFAAAGLLALVAAAEETTSATDKALVGEPTVSRTVQLRKGVTLKRLVFNEPRLMVAFVARVDLTTPGIGFTATERDPLWGQPMPDYTNELWLVNTKRETTVDFMARRHGAGQNVEIAFNTSGWRPWPGRVAVKAKYAALYRWDMVDGQELSCGKMPGMGTYFIVRKDGSVFIRSVIKSHMTNDWAIALYGNRALLKDGQRTKDGTHKPDVDPAKGGEPRTALGLTPDRKTLVILAVDGRQPGYSEGASFADVADIMLMEGCSDAVNMDGGGSTSFVVWDRENACPQMLNRHANGYRRRVAINLGITFSD